MADTAGIGHNGGPQARKGRKLSHAQLRALSAIRDHGNAAHGLVGRARMGGFNNTVWWLSKEGLRVHDEAGRATLTERGLRVLEAGRMVD